MNMAGIAMDQIDRIARALVAVAQLVGSEANLSREKRLARRTAQIVRPLL